MSMKSTNLMSRIDPGFGTWLRGTRAGAGFNLTAFAAAAGLHQQTLRTLELGRRLEGVYPVEVFQRIADTLGMELGYVLHKAGFDLARDGLDLQRVTRIENVASAFGEHGADLRVAIAEAIAYVDAPRRAATERDMLVAEATERDMLVIALGRGLAALDRVTERLRREGFVAARSPAAQQAGPRPWAASELQFLAAHPTLSPEDAAAHLGRTADAVRTQRHRLSGETS